MRRAASCGVAILGGLGLISDPAPTLADLLTFRTGERVERPAVVRTDSVEVAMPDGVRVFPRSAFRTIEPGTTPIDEWPTRSAAAARSATADAGFAAAWWASENGLSFEATAAFRAAETLPGANDHLPLRRVGRILDRLDTHRANPDLTPTWRLLGGSSGWRVLVGHHVVLIHQASDADARARVAVLDAVVETFLINLSARGVALTFPDRHLVSVWFARQGEYLRWLRANDAEPFRSTQGYYHPTSGVVVAFDTRWTASQAEGRRALDADRVAAEVRGDERTRADIDRRALLLDLRWLAVDLGVAAHETVHQLVAATGLAPRVDDYPHWLHEGLAAQFEVVRDGRWAGVGRRNDLRLPDWHPTALSPLLRDDGLGHGYARERYAQAWSLVYFLRQTRPEEFATFLELLRNPHPADGPAEIIAPFQAAFGGDLPSLQAQWHHYLHNVDRDHNRLARPDALPKTSEPVKLGLNLPVHPTIVAGPTD